MSAAAATADIAPVTTRRRRRPSAVTVGVALIALLLLVRIFVAEPFRIPSESMAPTLKPGDQELVAKLGGHSPKRGQLVAFHSPRNGEVLLKRVVAVGGDTVGLEDGVLVVNRRQVREPFVNQKAIDSVYFGPVRVRPGTIFVMGDNRANSEDSRDFGAVKTSSIIGRAVARVWPPGRWGTTG
ncbi:MAG: signal peptidase [Solirubrobacteraceae bacterium]|jgi:signal peptidase I|nr:signal peptidase [Solirubrobacteraceae bacterium]